MESSKNTLVASVMKRNYLDNVDEVIPVPNNFNDGFNCIQIRYMSVSELE